MSTVVRAGLAVLVSLGLVASVAVVTPMPGGSDAASTHELSKPARELEEVLARAAAATYHARYDAILPGLDGAQVVVETWRRSGDVRQDLVAATPGGEVRTSTIEAGGRRRVCTRQGDGPWECRPEAAAASDPLLGAIREELATAHVSARDDRIGPYDVRCFVIGPGAERELCATADGVPVRVHAGGSRLSLVALDRAVDDKVFQGPDTEP